MNFPNRGMRPRANRRRCIAAALSLVSSFAWSASETRMYDDPDDDPAIHQMLREMDRASTLYHPDTFAEFAAIKRYVNKSYVGAMKYFELSALYADKFSQLSIGLMYVNGEGVAKDPVLGFAWLDLAAERGYPSFVATRDRVKSAMTEEQIARAQAMRDTLASRYGDAVAKPRMAQQLRFGMEHQTGSLVGFNYGVYTLQPTRIPTPCKGEVTVAGRTLRGAGCGSDDVNAGSQWDEKQYFSNYDAQWNATVNVGSIRPPETDATPPPAVPSTASPNPNRQ